MNPLQEIKQEIKQERDPEDFKMGQLEKVRLELKEIGKRIVANKGEERDEERLTLYKRALDNFKTDGNDVVASLRMASLDAISKCRYGLVEFVGSRSDLG